MIELGKQPRTRRQLMMTLYWPLMIAPLVIAVPLGWLLIELGVNWIVSVVSALVYGLAGAWTIAPLPALLAMDGKRISAQAPPSAVRYVAGLMLMYLIFLVALPVLVVVLLPVVLYAWLRKPD